MGLTTTKKILAANCGRKALEPGEFIRARVDMAVGNHLSAAGAEWAASVPMAQCG
jgi:hypothetical protein